MVDIRISFFSVYSSSVLITSFFFLIWSRDISTPMWNGHIRCASINALGLENLTNTYINTPL